MRLARRAPADARYFSTASLGLVGGTMLAVYGYFWLRPLFLGDFQPFQGSAQAIAPILGLNYAALSRYVAGFLIPTVLQVCALLLLPRVPRRPAILIVVLVAVAAPALVVYTYPAFAGDIFDYMMWTRMHIHYGVSPYAHAASDFAADPYFPPVVFKGDPANYGPAFFDVAAVPLAIAGGNTVLALVLMKLLAVVLHLGTAVFVYLTVRKLAPERSLWSLAAYAWNPFVIIYIGVDGHNDALMTLFLVASVYFAVSGNWSLAFPFLTLAGLVKYVPFLLFPVFLLAARRDWRRLVGPLVVSVLLVALIYFPFWAGTHTFDGVRGQAARMTSSPARMLDFVLPQSWLRPLALGVFGVGYLAVVARVKGVHAQSFAVVILYYFTLSFWQKPWYLTWAVALGAIVGYRAFWSASLAGVGGFVANCFGGWGWMMNWWDWQARWGAWMMELWLTASLYLGWLLGGAFSLALWFGQRRLRLLPSRPNRRPPADGGGHAAGDS